MRFANFAAFLGGIILVAALTGEATADDTDAKGTFTAAVAEFKPPWAQRPLDDLDLLRARGPQGVGDPSPRVREAIGPIFFIFLLQQARFSGGIDILQRATIR